MGALLHTVFFPSEGSKALKYCLSSAPMHPPERGYTLVCCCSVSPNWHCAGAWHRPCRTGASLGAPHPSQAAPSPSVGAGTPILRGVPVSPSRFWRPTLSSRGSQSTSPGSQEPGGALRDGWGSPGGAGAAPAAPCAQRPVAPAVPARCRCGGTSAEVPGSGVAAGLRRAGGLPTSSAGSPPCGDPSAAGPLRGGSVPAAAAPRGPPWLAARLYHAVRRGPAAASPPL